MKNSIRACFGGLLLCAATVGCNKSDGPPPGEKKPFEEDKLAPLIREVVPVKLATVQKRLIRNVYKSTALLRAQRDVELLISVGDVVGKVHFREGDRVKKGDLIAKIKSFSLGIQYQRQTLAVENARRLHRQSEELLKKEHIPRETWEQTKLDLRNAELAKQETATSITRLSIVAPFDGVVAANDLEEGAFVSSFSGKPPIRVVDSDNLQGEFSLPVLYYGSMMPDQKVLLRTRGMTVEAKVERVAPVVDQSTGTFVVQFALSNQGPSQFFPGERVNLEVPMGEGRDRIILPEKSVVFEGAVPFVYVPREPTEQEIASDIERLKNPQFAMGPGDGKGRKGRKGGRNGRGSGGGAFKKNGPSGKSPDGSGKPVEITDEDKARIKSMQRADKIKISVEQLPSGEYALVEDHLNKGSRLESGDEVIVIGLSQMANATRIEIIKGL